MNTYAAYTDQALLALMQQNDADAFTELYNRFWKMVYGAVYPVLQNKETARDIVQDIFISLWERRHEIEISHPAAYLRQAARFQVFKAIRNNKIHDGFYKRMEAVSEIILEDNPAIFKELTELLHKILATLPEDQRKAFLLSRDAGMSYKEIAVSMNISTKTVEKKISGTLKRLRVGLDKAFLIALLFFIKN